MLLQIGHLYDSVSQHYTVFGLTCCVSKFITHHSALIYVTRQRGIPRQSWYRFITLGSMEGRFGLSNVSEHCQRKLSVEKVSPGLEPGIPGLRAQ